MKQDAMTLDAIPGAEGATAFLDAFYRAPKGKRFKVGVAQDMEPPFEMHVVAKIGKVVMSVTPDEARALAEGVEGSLRARPNQPCPVDLLDLIEALRVAADMAEERSRG